jgi:hypothetical protein
VWARARVGLPVSGFKHFRRLSQKWYKNHSIENHQNQTLLNILYLVIKTWQICEILKWKLHKRHVLWAVGGGGGIYMQYCISENM